MSLKLNTTTNDNPTINENPTEVTDVVQKTEVVPMTETDAPQKKKGKEKIPTSVKNTLWSLHFQGSLNGICQCCKTENISKNNFDCGHVLSEKDGGSVALSNLKPICRSCNSSMGTMNMNDFIKKYGFDQINTEVKTEFKAEIEKIIREEKEEKKEEKKGGKKETKKDEKKDTTKEDKTLKEEKLKEDKLKEKEKEEKLLKEKEEKEEEKLIKDTEKLEKQLKDSMDIAIKLQKEAAIAMENAVGFQTDYMIIYNQLLGKCKNDDLKKICQILKMSKTGYANKEEFLRNIYEFLNEKNLNDIKDICKELNIKGKSIISIIYYLSKNITNI